MGSTQYFTVAPAVQTTTVTEVIPVVLQQDVIQNTTVQQTWSVQGVEFNYVQGDTNTVTPAQAGFADPSCNDLPTSGRQSFSSTKSGCGCRR
ncbi:MAG: hypothetical protein FWF59_10300 [Turicibacter sp.]|nr:hypothetical protein [Turicibacter sp.]